jgi:hypothetical protein
MPGKREWGPPLWKLLHGLTESLGNQTVAILSTDEAHEIVFLLRDLDKIMPCALCRNHYIAWRKTHPIETLGRLRGPMLRDGVRKYLYDLHQDVNERNSVQCEIKEEDLHELYKTIDIRAQWAEFLTKIKLSTEVGLVSQTALTNFHRHLGLLRKLIGR